MLVRRLAKDGGSGVEVRVIPMLTEIIIHATQTQNVLCKQGRRELAARVQKISTVIQASWRICCSENLLWCPGFVMKREVRVRRFVVNEKPYIQHAKSVTFKDEYMISSDQSVGGLY